MQPWYRQAFDTIRSREVAEAFAIEREPARLRERYGRGLFGQGCLLARRLLEAGVGLVTVYWHYEGPDDSPVWDTHWNNFTHLRQRLAPPTDQAVAAVLDDLHQRGLLDDTLVICMGEFGRTPRINNMAGRDHWSSLQTILLAGAGIRSGIVHGSSDRQGGVPASDPVVPADLTATFLHLLGVPADLEFTDRLQRPLRACTGSVVPGLFE
jgi:arylsulfatase A-like enzyme